MIESAAMVTGEGLLALIDVLARVDHDVSDAQRVDELAALERIKGACAAAQAAITVAFLTSQEREQAERRRHRGADRATCSSRGGEAVRRESLGRGIAGQVALARRESPVRGSQHVRLALALLNELPNTYDALASGRLTEARAEIIARESAHLSGAARTAFDAELVMISRYDDAESVDDANGTDGESRERETGGDADVSGLGSLGDRELTRRVRALAYRADPAAAQERFEKAVRARRVELRRGADAMCRLTAHLPLAQAIAAQTALTAAADSARAVGDPRGKGQLMADTLVERVTGQATADAVPVEVQLIITDESLFQGGDTPAQVPGYGTVPAAWARSFLHPDSSADQPAAPSGDEFGSYGTAEPDHTFGGADWTPSGYGPSRQRDHEPWAAATDPPQRDSGRCDGPARAPANDQAPSASDDAGGAVAERARAWLRRLYTQPTTGQLVAMESTRRVFDGNLRRFLIARDAATCRTPWCDAPIRHLDHIRDFADGGPTTAVNGQGLCARCNHTKNHPGWHCRTLTQPESRPHTTETTTPTGHAYRSTAPPILPGLIQRHPCRAADDPSDLSPMERYLTHRLLTEALRVG